MKATANVRKIDELASETLKVYDTAQRMDLNLSTREIRLSYEGALTACALCNATRNTKHYKGKMICQDCIDVIKEIAGQ
jgi:hypothetical protein